jgi:hypothetical protein
LLRTHTQSGLYISVSSIVENDSKLILSFFESALDSSKIYHCIIVQQYLQLLGNLDIQSKESLRVQYQSAEYELYDLLTNKLERAELKLSNGSYKKYRNKKILELTASYSEEDYDKILHQLWEILQTLEESSHWQIKQGILSLFENLFNRNVNLSYKVLRHYLEQGDYLEIDPCIVMSNMLQKCETEKVFDVINAPEYSTKDGWLFSYYQHLPSNKIQKKHMKALCELYTKSENKYFISNLDYLLKYEAIQKGFVVDIVGIVIKRNRISPEYARSISFLFHSHTEININIHSLFSGNFNLLEDAYIAVSRVDHLADYNGSFLTMLLNNDQSFIDRYLEDKFLRKEYLSRYDDHRDYSFIWSREDCDTIMQRITSVVFNHERKGNCVGYYEAFFKKGVNSQTNNLILDAQDRYLMKEIEIKYGQNEYMQFLFAVIVVMPQKRKLKFYKIFLAKNSEFNDFKKLPYEHTVSTWSGSAVPMLQEKIEFYEEIQQICNSIQLLRHRQFIEQVIQKIREQIQHEKKRDFTEEKYYT